MKSFKTDTGTHVVQITVATVRELRSRFDIDLMQCITDKTLLPKLAEDPVLLVDVLEVCCGRNENGNWKVADLGNVFGDAIEEATAAFLEALTDFFPGARREVLKKALDATRQFEMKAKKQIQETLDGDIMQKMVDRQLATLKSRMSQDLASLVESPK